MTPSQPQPSEPRSRKMYILWAIALALLLPTVSCRGKRSVRPIVANGVTAITFRRGEMQVQFRVKDPRLVAEFLKALRPVKWKDECACDHLQQAVFTGPEGETVASFCDHCFQVISRNGKQTYEYHRITRSFHDLFKRHRQAQHKDSK
jgi:hypothetical protein